MPPSRTATRWYNHQQRVNRALDDIYMRARCFGMSHDWILEKRAALYATLPARFPREYRAWLSGVEAHRFDSLYQHDLSYHHVMYDPTADRLFMVDATDPAHHDNMRTIYTYRPDGTGRPYIVSGAHCWRLLPTTPEHMRDPVKRVWSWSERIEP